MTIRAPGHGKGLVSEYNVVDKHYLKRIGKWIKLAQGVNRTAPKITLKYYPETKILSLIQECVCTLRLSCRNWLISSRKINKRELNQVMK